MYDSLRRFVHASDWILFLTALILSAIGGAAIYSIDLSLHHPFSGSFLLTQCIALALGVVAYLVCSLLHESVYRAYAPIAYAVALAMLLAVLFFGLEIRGTKGWFRLAGFSFQPAEFAKLGLALGLGWLVERYGRRFERFSFVLASGLCTALPLLLIMMQPDLGSALVLGLVWFSLLIIAKTRWYYIAGIVAGGIAAFLIGWFFLFVPYQKDRLLTFIYPDRDPLRSGYNVAQSVIAVGSGQWFGRGLGFGSQSQLRFLPEAQTDFIFSVLAEELGFFGLAVMLTLFAALFWRILRRVRSTNSEFGAYAGASIMVVFFAQVVFNIGGALGLLPITGVTLPFVSYGGSSLLINYILLGIVASVTHGTEA